MHDKRIERKVFPDGIFYELHSGNLFFSDDTIWVIVTNNHLGETTIFAYDSESLARRTYLAMIEKYGKRMLL